MDDRNSKVKRVQIGTHSRSIEQGLRDLFWRDGWLKLDDYASDSTEQTPWGEITFVDGVQTWVNPVILSKLLRPNCSGSGLLQSADIKQIRLQKLW